MQLPINIVPVRDADMVKEQTRLRFKDPLQFKTAEAVILYEQNIVDDKVLFNLCQQEYPQHQLSLPMAQYVAANFVAALRGYNCVPLKYDVSTATIIVGVLPEIDEFIPDLAHIRVRKVYVPIYYYVTQYLRLYGPLPFLNAIPAVDKFDMIVQEAIHLGAMDITITNVASGAQVYYNVRKKKVHSRRQLSREDVTDIADLLASKASFPNVLERNKPKYFSVQLDIHNRGRVVQNATYYGEAITIRVISDDLLTVTLEDLNIDPKVCEFIRTHVLSREKGLRLFIGETASGKNTTILSALSEIVAKDIYKVVSLEMPVEALIDGVEQISVETEEDYNANASSLLRQNPDVVYLTEITDFTARDAINISNTGKCVFSSLHANSVSDVLPRLQDITGLSIDRLILSLHSCVYQELVRNEETDSVYPINRCVYFSDDLKSSLYGKSLGEVKQILQEKESAW